ncbi:MAG: alpha-L-fucosidase [bacterium]|nr:alpha-L-fucosidase [bacterium]
MIKNSHLKNIVLLIIISLGIAMSLHTQEYKPTWESLDKRPMPRWFVDAKFGIFIHWGVYSVPAWRKVTEGRYASYAEWYYARVMESEKNGGAAFHQKNYGKDFEYRDFGPMFKAELFDPDYWAGLFARSGAKYVVLTSKHHDGYCLWPTKSPFKKNWNSMDTGPKRDLVGDLTAAVRKKGLKMGLYYSIIEWESTPTKRTETGYFINKKTVDKYRIPEDRYVDHHLIPQLKELVTNYQPAVIFSDGGEWDRTTDQWKVKEFLAWMYNEAANKDEVVVNDRWGTDTTGKHGDYFSSEYEDTDAVGVSHPWEESRGVGGSYGFNRDENIDDYSTSEGLVHELIDIVSRGGNLLLNVGPTADGRIPVIMQQRLVDIGDWLKVNGEAVYGTRPWKKKTHKKENKEKGIFYTKKDKTLYVIRTSWPGKAIVVAGLKPGKETVVTMLGLKKKIKWSIEDGKMSIEPPAITPAEVPCQYAYVFKINI